MKFLWLIMALHIFNCSVDMPDLNPEYIPEDLSINDIESIVELVLEEILGFENAIKEYDDQDSNDGSVFSPDKSIDLSYYPTSPLGFSCQDSLLFDSNHSLYRPLFLERVPTDLASPPPKA